MGEFRNKNSYYIGYFVEFQWQRRVLLSYRQQWLTFTKQQECLR